MAVDVKTAPKFEAGTPKALFDMRILRLRGNFFAYRYDVTADGKRFLVDSVSTGLMGLTMGCVRCHSHKFDPLPHEDYYHLMAVFASAYNPDQWLPPADRSR